jgi:NitT/TauT family transport system substrate-binding protein
MSRGQAAARLADRHERRNSNPVDVIRAERGIETRKRWRTIMRLSTSSLVAGTLLALSAGGAAAADKTSLIMSWKAQAEHGGYYQALVKGYYGDCGLDMTIRQGGPGIDTAQLLVGGAVEFAMVPFIDAVLQMNQAGYPARAIMAGFQRSAQILMTHAGNGIETMEDMRGKPIMISAASRTTFWPFLRDKYGWSDSQIRTYTGQLATFFADRAAVQQALITNEPFLVKRQTGETPKTFLLFDYGYQTYASIIVTSQAMIEKNPKAVQCVVDASVKGWGDFLKNPKPGLDAIKKEEPQNTDDLMGYTLQTIIDRHLVQTADTEQSGLGIMSDARWKAHYEMLLAQKLIKPLDYRTALDLRFLSKKPAN